MQDVDRFVASKSSQSNKVLYYHLANLLILLEVSRVGNRVPNQVGEQFLEPVEIDGFQLLCFEPIAL